MTASQKILDNIPQLALQHALQNRMDEVSGSTIYGVMEAWQTAELQKHPEIKTVRDAKSLEQAVAAPECKIIFVPADAEITQAITRSILQRNPLNKQILWEVHTRTKT